MSKRSILFLLSALLPLFALAQEPPASWPSPNALTMQVLMSQRPAHIPEAQWAEMVLKPVHASLYPIRITQAMLDTIDARQLDMRYQYIMMREELPPALVHKE